MPAGSKIEAALVEALGDKFEAKDNEKRSARLKRIVKAVSEHVSDEQYNKLPKPAQEWYAKGLDEHKAGKPISEFPDAPEEPADEPTEKKGGKKTAKKAKAEKKTKGEKKPRETGPSAKSELIKLRLRKPNADLASLLAELKTKSYTMSENTASVLDGHTRAVIRVATDIGWKPKEKE